MSDEQEIYTPATGVVLSSCDNCFQPVVDGPEGGYCCSRCGHSVDPPNVVMTRRQAEWARRKANRETSWAGFRHLAASLTKPEAYPRHD